MPRLVRFDESAPLLVRRLIFEKEEALQLLGVGEDEVVTDFNHGICPPCMDHWHATQAEAKAQSSVGTAA